MDTGYDHPVSNSYAVELPTTLHRQLRRACDDRGVVMARLIRSWVILAADQARQGQELPPGGTAGRPRGAPRSPDCVQQTRWRQDAAELALCRHLINGAGSSLRAVVERSARCWVDSPATDLPASAATALTALRQNAERPRR